jgi:hypothetical protein
MKLKVTAIPTKLETRHRCHGGASAPSARAVPRAFDLSKVFTF